MTKKENKILKTVYRFNSYKRCLEKILKRKGEIVDIHYHENKFIVTLLDGENESVSYETFNEQYNMWDIGTYFGKLIVRKKFIYGHPYFTLSSSRSKKLYGVAEELCSFLNCGKVPEWFSQLHKISDYALERNDMTKIQVVRTSNNPNKPNCDLEKKKLIDSLLITTDDEPEYTIHTLF